MSGERTPKTFLLLLAFAGLLTGCGKSEPVTPVVASQQSPYCVPWQANGFGNDCEPPTTIDQACLGRGVLTNIGNGQQVCKSVMNFTLNADTGIFSGTYRQDEPWWTLPNVGGLRLYPGDELVVTGAARWSPNFTLDPREIADINLIDGYTRMKTMTVSPGVTAVVATESVIMGAGIAATGLKSYRLKVDAIRVIRCYDFQGKVVTCSPVAN